MKGKNNKEKYTESKNLRIPPRRPIYILWKFQKKKCKRRGGKLTESSNGQILPKFREINKYTNIKSSSSRIKPRRHTTRLIIIIVESKRQRES